MKKQIYKIITFVPQTHLEQLRITVCNAGAGRTGKYDNCTFMSSGIGTYRPLKGAKPFQGEIDKLERVGDAKLETFVEKKNLNKIVDAIRKVHPYEEPVIEVYKLFSNSLG